MAYYAERILERYKAPRHKGSPEGATHVGEAVNPLCGDELTVWARVVGGRVEAAGFDGVGCAVSQAAADLLSEAWRGASLREAASWGLGEVLEVLGSPVGPARERCALLPVEALARAAGAPAGGQ